MHSSKTKVYLGMAGLLLIYFLTRIAGLEVLPLHNDEGLHLTRAVEVWNLHPFWAIGDGKFVNHWPIALLYPQNAPVFVSRFPTVLVSILGFAAGLALVRRDSSRQFALLAGLLWISTPYLFFYERISQSDAQAGALVVVTLWAAQNAAKRGRARDAMKAGAIFGTAVLFKLTAAPYALVLLVVLSFGSGRLWRARIRSIVLSGTTGALLVAMPLVYLALKSRDLSIALGWVSGSQRSWLAQFAANLGDFWANATGFGPSLWLAVLIVGLFGLLLERRNLVLLASAVIPAVVIMLLAKEMEPRHSTVMLAVMVVASSVGLHSLFVRLRAERLGVFLVAIPLLIVFIPFAIQAYRDPGQLSLPQRVREQFVTTHSAGYGLREAVSAFPDTIAAPDMVIIGSMFPDSCKRANFYAQAGFHLTCVQAPGLSDVATALESGQAAVYVLREGAGLGLDEAALRRLGRAEQIAAYPRPGEPADMASVTLWQIEAVE